MSEGRKPNRIPPMWMSVAQSFSSLGLNGWAGVA